jgi:hypothetical protein
MRGAHRREGLGVRKPLLARFEVIKCRVREGAKVGRCRSRRSSVQDGEKLTRTPAPAAHRVCAPRCHPARVGELFYVKNPTARRLYMHDKSRRG